MNTLEIVDTTEISGRERAVLEIEVSETFVDNGKKKPFTSREYGHDAFTDNDDGTITSDLDSPSIVQAMVKTGLSKGAANFKATGSDEFFENVKSAIEYEQAKIDKQSVDDTQPVQPSASFTEVPNIEAQHQLRSAGQTEARVQAANEEIQHRRAQQDNQVVQAQQEDSNNESDQTDTRISDGKNPEETKPVVDYASEVEGFNRQALQGRISYIESEQVKREVLLNDDSAFAAYTADRSSAPENIRELLETKHNADAPRLAAYKDLLADREYAAVYDLSSQSEKQQTQASGSEKPAAANNTPKGIDKEDSAQQPANTVESTKTKTAIDEAEIKRRNALAKRVVDAYVVDGNRYMLRGERPQEAFRDNGNTIKAKLDDERTVTDAVDLLASRGVESIKVSGTKVFNRNAWIAAQTHGMEVHGYKPTAQDLALFQKKGKHDY